MEVTEEASPEISERLELCRFAGDGPEDRGDTPLEKLVYLDGELIERWEKGVKVYPAL